MQSDICNYSDAYIVVRGGTITVTDPNNDTYDKKMAFKNNSTFISCTSKINNTLIDNAEDLDIVMPMYNFLERSKNYSKTTGSLWNISRDEPKSGAVGNLNCSIIDLKSFDYKTSITRRLIGKNAEKEDVKIVVLLKHLCNFSRTLGIPLINDETNLILMWSENCVITSKATRDVDSM